MNTSNSQWPHFPADVQRATVRVHRVKQYLVLFVYLTICHLMPCTAQAKLLNPEQSRQVVSNGRIMLVQNLISENISSISTSLNQGVEFRLESLNNSVSGLPTRSSPALVDPDKSSNKNSEQTSENVSLYSVCFDVLHCIAYCLSEFIQTVTSIVPWWVLLLVFIILCRPSDSSNSSGKGI